MKSLHKVICLLFLAAAVLWLLPLSARAEEEEELIPIEFDTTYTGEIQGDGEMTLYQLNTSEWQTIRVNFTCSDASALIRRRVLLFNEYHYIRPDYEKELDVYKQEQTVLCISGTVPGAVYTLEIIPLTSIWEADMEPVEFIFNGNSPVIHPTVTLYGTPLTEGVDYTVSWQSASYAGEFVGELRGKGRYTSYHSFKYRILPRPIDNATVTGLTDRIYTGSPITQTGSIRVTLEDGTSLWGSDGTWTNRYKVTYKNNTDVGTATVIISGVRNYTGQIETSFRILPISLSGASVSGIKASVPYAGKPITQKPVVVLKGKTLKAGTDYTVSYKNNNAAGTATLIVQGRGTYTGKATRTFKITAANGLVTANTQLYAASTGSLTVSALREGRAVKILSKLGSRWQVKAGTATGWIDGNYLYDLATVSPTAADRIGQGVTTKTVTVYATPTANLQKITTLKAGVVRNLYAQTGNWYQIFTGGKYGWVRVDGFDFTQALTSVPIARLTAAKNLQTYYGPGRDYEKSAVVIPKGKPMNVYRISGNWALVYRSGKYLWVAQSK